MRTHKSPILVVNKNKRKNLNIKADHIYQKKLDIISPMGETHKKCFDCRCFLLNRIQFIDRDTRILKNKDKDIEGDGEKIILTCVVTDKANSKLILERISDIISNKIFVFAKLRCNNNG